LHRSAAEPWIGVLAVMRSPRAAREAQAQAWERSISGRATGKIVIDIG